MALIGRPSTRPTTSPMAAPIAVDRYGECQYRPILCPAHAPASTNANHGNTSNLPFSRGRNSNADRAGERVSELNAEISVETAIVRANWRKNWPVIPVIKAHGTNTADSTSPIATTGPDTNSI